MVGGYIVNIFAIDGY